MKSYIIAEADKVDYPKHYYCILPLLKYWGQRGISYYFAHQKNLPPEKEVYAIIGFNTLKKKLFDELKGKYHKNLIPFVLIDHGCSNLKWFLNNWKRYDQYDLFLVPGLDHKKSLEMIHGTSKPVVVTSFIGSNNVLSNSKIEKEDLLEVPPLTKIILYAPTWTEKINRDHRTILKELEKLEKGEAIKTVISGHLDRANLGRNEDIRTIEIVKHADLVISETSSILYEAVRTGKRVLQVLMNKYSDNPAKKYELPFTAGTLERFQIGITTRPENLVEVANQIMEMSQEEYLETTQEWREKTMYGINIDENALDIINKSLETWSKKFRKGKIKRIEKLYRISVEERHSLVNITFKNVLGHFPWSKKDIIYHQKYISPDGDTKVLELVLKTSQEYTNRRAPFDTKAHTYK